MMMRYKVQDFNVKKQEASDCTRRYLVFAENAGFGVCCGGINLAF
jgi:hypothetical protein